MNGHCFSDRKNLWFSKKVSVPHKKLSMVLKYKMVRYWYASKEQSLLFDLLKVFDNIESSHKLEIFLRKSVLSFMRAQHVLSYLARSGAES